MAALIEREIKTAEVELIPSGGGVFEVTVDGERIHSKKKTGEFPEFDDVLDALRDR
ncbi:MAG: SelT/SelW/SelH family protein [Gemmatimonadetes bacterium]|nr:SelT/SelW/SelH family protein [Gemmatimonadota bacterium]